MYRSLLVPLDGSRFAEHALPRALTIARCSGATLQLIHVHVPSTLAGAIDVPPVFDDTRDIPSREDERAYLAGLVQRITASWNVPVTQTLLDGPTVTTLHEHIIASGADLVVMTTHGRGALSRFWLGSVADALVRQAPVPVLLVRPYEEAADFLRLDREQPFKHVLIALDGSRLAEDILDHAVALIVGIFTHFAALMGIIMNLAYLLAGTTSTNPNMLVVGMVVLLAGGIAVGYYGLDFFARPMERDLFHRTRTRFFPQPQTA